ncbi:MAG: hypothetical protein ABIJ47_09020 [Candidatus Bathyarchaeota archaeon]
MPGVHGLDVLRTLKLSRSTRHIPVLLLTALGTGVDMMLEKGEKADCYMMKPFSVKELVRNMRRLLPED